MKKAKLIAKQTILSKGMLQAILGLIQTFQSMGITLSSGNDESNPFYKLLSWANHVVELILNKIGARYFTNIEMMVLLSCIFPFFCSSVFLGFTHGVLFLIANYALSYTVLLYDWLINKGAFDDQAYGITMIVIQSLCYIFCAFFCIKFRSSGWCWKSLFSQCEQKDIIPFFVVTVLGIPGSLFVDFFFYHIGNENPIWCIETDPETIQRIDSSFVSFGIISLLAFFLCHYSLQQDNQLLYVVMVIAGIFIFAHCIFEASACLHKVAREQFVTFLCKGYVILSRILLIPCVNYFFSVPTAKQDGEFIYGGLFFYLWAFSVAFPLFYTTIFSFLGYKIRKTAIPIVFRLFLENVFSVTSFISSGFKSRFVLWPIIDSSYRLLYSVLAGFRIPEANIAFSFLMAIALGVFRPYLLTSSNIIEIGESIVLGLSNIFAVVYKNPSLAVPQGLAIALIVIAFLPLIVSSIFFFIKELNHKQDYIENDIKWEVAARKLKDLKEIENNPKKKQKLRKKIRVENTSNEKFQTNKKEERGTHMIDLGGGVYYNDAVDPENPAKPKILSKFEQLEKLLILFRELNAHFDISEENFKFDKELTRKFDDKAKDMKNQNDKVVIFLSYFCLSILFFVGSFVFFEAICLYW